VWKIVSFCILWCILRERNYKSFENLERTIEEHRSLFFHTRYPWTVSYIFPLVLSFHDFLIFFLLLARSFFLYISCVLGGALHYLD
jgi:hypothetical protein